MSELNELEELDLFTKSLERLDELVSLSDRKKLVRTFLKRRGFFNANPVKKSEMSPQRKAAFVRRMEKARVTTKKK